MSKKNKKNKLLHSKRIKKRKKILEGIREDQIEKMIEEDCKDAPDPERCKEYMRSSFKRQEEYYQNIKRDPSDPKWESSHGG